MLLQENIFAGVTKSESGDMSQDFLRSDEWRKIVAQVESALCREDRSRQALDQLQQLATEQGASTQFLLKSVIRETIRFTLECFGDVADMLKRADIPPATEISPVTDFLPAPEVKIVPPTPEQREIEEDAAMFDAIAHVLTPPTGKSLLERMCPPKTPKLSPEFIAQQSLEARESALRSVCVEIRQHRFRLGLTLPQIHARTFIPLHYLRAFEESRIDCLPEDVYLRGFLRRIEKELHLADGQLTQILPKLPPIDRSLVSSAMTTRSAHSPLSLAFASNYAYITYAALMAGGLFLIAQQGSPKSTLSPLKIDPAPASGPQNSSQNTSSRQVQQTHAQLHQNVARPEVFG